ncbi:extensin family protein [Roseibium sp. CAU 1637]|uniref:Extensin family protein n=1 Tax=Roseibium limicola TaxID=2816037 RepID=A0A939EKW0_9HYPH|nr:extensin family protein [Roseibium limicola]MBO0343726.1 extensin family protein [Roseibium limicola]
MASAAVLPAYGQPVPLEKPAAAPFSGSETDHMVDPADPISPVAKPSKFDTTSASQSQSTPSRPLNPSLKRRLDPGEYSAESCEIDGVDLKVLPPISGKGACGVPSAVSLRSVGTSSEMDLSGHPAITCEFAGSFARFVRKGVQPAARLYLKTHVAELETGPGYVCRRRNNRPTGKISEHALGKAIDVMGFKLEDGGAVSVEQDWAQDTPKGRFLKAVHTAACSEFTTVLGPDADANHRNHFHLDIGCHGKTCTYLICQ